jgi:hypothetical protein
MESPFPNHVTYVPRDASRANCTERNPYKIGCPTNALNGLSLQYLEVFFVSVHFLIQMAA